LDQNGVIDRVKLSDVVFTNPEKRMKLNKLSHPRIFGKMIKELIRIKFRVKNPLVVLDAPLLFESKFLEFFCYPILVVSLDDGQE
jgi:dephospho-CoA kinase